jgi:hypothetical protein
MSVEVYNSEKARELLKEAFPFTEKTTVYIAGYRTESGREIALERDRAEAFYVWVQKYDVEIEGIAIQNKNFPGKPYDRRQTRNSNLNDKNSPKLQFGNRAWYLRIDNLEAVRTLIYWYGKV